MSITDQRLIDLKIPRHIAIIMDGNGRWAKKNNKPRVFGHRQGMKSVRKAVEYCVENEIEVLTLYAFSTENWKRPGKEVEFLMKLLKSFIQSEIDELDEKGVQVTYIGDISKLPDFAREELLRGMEKTRNNKKLILNLALNYSGKSEIVRAVNRVLQDKTLEISEENISKHLDTAGQPDPDLMIRTSGEIRISNFMLWQLAYTELIFLEKYWPEFEKEDLFNAIQDYNQRNRRFGGIN